MARVETFACDICSVQKKDANRWWKVYRVHGAKGILIVPWETESISGKLELSTDGEIHLCGENHVCEWISKHLGSS